MPNATVALQGAPSPGVLSATRTMAGLSGATIFLNDYRMPIIFVSLAVNAAEIAVTLGVRGATRVRGARGSYLVAGGTA